MDTRELLRKPNKLRGSDLRWTNIPPEGVGILLTPSCYKNRDKLSLSWLAPTFNLIFFLTKALLLRACNR